MSSTFLHITLGLLLSAFNLLAQSRTYRVEDNGQETIGYCTLRQGEVIHKYTQLPAGKAPRNTQGNGGESIDIPDFAHTEERFTVESGIPFDQVFAAIHARYCIRQGYQNIQSALREKQELNFHRQIKAITAYYDQAIDALAHDDRLAAMEAVQALSRFTHDTPFRKGQPAPGYIPEYVRLVENALNATIRFTEGHDPEYRVVKHQPRPEEVTGKTNRRRRR